MRRLSSAGTFTGAAGQCAAARLPSSLQQRLGQPALTLIDARALPRFKGEVEPIDPVAGHIPGAQCAAFTDNLGSDGRFLPADQLKQRFAAKLGERSPAELVAYCGSGVTACHNLFALCLAGIRWVRCMQGRGASGSTSLRAGIGESRVVEDPKGIACLRSFNDVARQPLRNAPFQVVTRLPECAIDETDMPTLGLQFELRAGGQFVRASASCEGTQTDRRLPE